MQQPHVPIEEMDMFGRYIEVADWVWNIVADWAPLPRDTVGKQLVRAVDSVGANLVEGDGRQTTGDSVHFFVIARASAREARYWLERAIIRKLIPAEEGRARIEALTEATRMLNSLIAYRRRRGSSAKVRERQERYDVAAGDPFTAE